MKSPSECRQRGFRERFFFVLLRGQKNDNNSSFNKRCIREHKKRSSQRPFIEFAERVEKRVNEWTGFSGK